MSLKRILLLGTFLLVAGISLLQFFVNQGGKIGGEQQAAGRERFRVGFLPVT